MNGTYFNHQFVATSYSYHISDHLLPSIGVSAQGTREAWPRDCAADVARATVTYIRFIYLPDSYIPSLYEIYDMIFFINTN